MKFDHSKTFASEADRKITEDQLDQVVTAILKGKYSWACVLILRFAQYDPLHYIPYRTYNRLLKKNQYSSRDDSCIRSDLQTNASYQTQHKKKVFQDLDYLEDITSHQIAVKGGTRFLGLGGLY